jgi:alcohol dehydrogenase
MKAALYKKFKGPILVQDVKDPSCAPGGVVVEVKATGICRSDWWGWQGNDSDIHLPHVPGHELAGVLVEIGSDVKKWKVGDRVTVPFVGGCGRCTYCLNGQQQICDHQFQPGFTAWGSFAEYVAIDFADENLVLLPDEMSFVDAASLGCRFITAYRALVYQGRLQESEFVSVYGCGGVGLSAILIAKAIGARVLAVDISDRKLEFASDLGADVIINSNETAAPEEIREITRGGCHVSMDALGLGLTCQQSIMSLRKQGRHIQVGLMEGEDLNVEIPMNHITGWELELYGSHGMQATKYPEIFKLIEKGLLAPGRLVSNTVTLEKGVQILEDMENQPPLGIAVIDDLT